jgi:hypothetical protein
VTASAQAIAKEKRQQQDAPKAEDQVKKKAAVCGLFIFERAAGAMSPFGT